MANFLYTQRYAKILARCKHGKFVFSVRFIFP